jgi:hypothetical protein
MISVNYKTKKGGYMKKLALYTVLLIASVSLYARPLGLAVGVTGGIERLTWEGGGTDNLTAIGLTATFSPPVLPLGIRAGLEYAWKNYDYYGDTTNVTSSATFYDFSLFLGIEYYIALPLSPLSFYVGAGFESSRFGGEIFEIAGLLEPGESVTKNGFLIYGGVNLNVGMITVFAESGYGRIFYEVWNAHLPLRGGIKVSF